MAEEEKTVKSGLVRRVLRWMWQPSPRALGTLLTTGVAAGVIMWGGFNWALELTNTEGFCISCHEMKDNVYADLKRTVHYTNRSGVRATCPDCHVPREWAPKLVRKVKASSELYYHLLGTVSTPEAFEARRIQLAVNEWTRLKSTDSHECRNCHQYQSMDYASQEPRSSKTHQEGFAAGKTCIDCHQGIAHKLPPRAKEAYQKMVESQASGDTKALAEFLKGVSAPAK